MDKMTIIKALLCDADAGTTVTDVGAWEVGKNYLIRTVTHIQTGRLVMVCAQELVLEGAAWIADTGRFTGALQSCEFSEVEQFPPNQRVVVGRGAVVDAVQIKTLPRCQK